MAPPRQKIPRVRESDRQYLKAIASVSGDVTIPKIQEQLLAKFNQDIQSKTVHQRLVKLVTIKLIRRVNGIESFMEIRPGRPLQCYELTHLGLMEICSSDRVADATEMR